MTALNQGWDLPTGTGQTGLETGRPIFLEVPHTEMGVLVVLPKPVQVGPNYFDKAILKKCHLRVTSVIKK